jgi:pimeloyl-ACP methyl ester carboxylesterase
MPNIKAVAPVVRSRFIESQGLRTHYLEAGSPEAPAVVLLHDGAWGGSSDVSWGQCLPGFAADYHVIAFDFFGFGDSDKVIRFDRAPYESRVAQLESLLDALGFPEPIHVVGTSFGGSVALRLLQGTDFPIRSVTSIGGSGGPWKTDTMLDQLGRWDGSREDLERVLSFLMEHTDGFEEQLTARMRAASVPGHYRALASPAMQIPRALQERSAAIRDDWPKSISLRDVPTLLIAGSNDLLFEPEWPENVSAELSRVTIVRMEALHSPNLDQAAQVVATVSDFIDGIETETQAERA